MAQSLVRTNLTTNALTPIHSKPPPDVSITEPLDLQNYTILGQPFKKNKRIVNAVKRGVSEKYDLSGE
ncbi:hypothetical protein Bhyg_06770 [Pseudolycoriella hygida]|uniref:Uncharacterized protein n=1 Tax=Pseudolycoriella hygida TaxID=35572 RepID=A0A9Q0N1F4_9DIPT|nr:hypothetical protein Bhyg_06770 [Pseudolycoriella hygida]